MLYGTALFLGSLLAAMPHLDNTMPARVTGPWTIEVGPGTVSVGEARAALDQAVTFSLVSPSPVHVKGEAHPALRVYNPNTGGWIRGERLTQLIAQECTSTDMLRPETVVVRSAADPDVVYERGTDYELDDRWATIGRVEGGAIAADTPVTIDYTYVPQRICSVVWRGGEARLLPGEPGLAVVYPPELHDGDIPLVNIWAAPGAGELTDEALFPVQPALPRPAPEDVEARALRHFPKTLAKLRAGEQVRIVAWGDSVTVGGGVLPDMEKRYQDQFLALLKQRYPGAGIEMLTAGWGGSRSQQWLDQPEGADHHFQRDVLDPKPDLVTIEFVNDAYFTEAQAVDHYKMLLDRINAAGAELIVLTPHLVRQDWMPVESVKFDHDPRPYVKGLRQFATRYDVALADASLEWCRLWRRGIPYPTLLGNAINHPEERGHRIFADALIALFPQP